MTTVELSRSLTQPSHEELIGAMHGVLHAFPDTSNSMCTTITTPVGVASLQKVGPVHIASAIRFQKESIRAQVSPVAEAQVVMSMFEETPRILDVHAEPQVRLVRWLGLLATEVNAMINPEPGLPILEYSVKRKRGSTPHVWTE